MLQEVHPIKLNGEIICYAVGQLNARLVSQAIYQLRGFFVFDFTEPSIEVEEHFVMDFKDLGE